MPTSRHKFNAYVREIQTKDPKSKRNEFDSFHSSMSREEKDKLVSRTHRTFWTLFKEFLNLIRGHHHQILVGLMTLTISTLLSLIPPLGTKLAIDSALSERPQPLPSWAPSWLSGSTPLQLLIWIAVAVTSITLVRTLIHLWGRWQCTKAVNQVQTALRKKVFDHMLQMPLQRVQQLKSGGSASLLREDAGGIADLVFSMLYNPWQAIVQLIGSLLVLVFVDWRLLVAGLLVLPVVYLTHRTWIYRIRPLYRDIRTTRQKVDANATETFSDTSGLVANPFDRSDLGNPHSTRFDPSTGLRWLANPPRLSDTRRLDDVLGLPDDAARTDRNTHGKRRTISKQPRRSRPNPRLAGFANRSPRDRQQTGGQRFATPPDR